MDEDKSDLCLQDHPSAVVRMSEDDNFIPEDRRKGDKRSCQPISVAFIVPGEENRNRSGKKRTELHFSEDLTKRHLFFYISDYTQKRRKKMKQLREKNQFITTHLILFVGRDLVELKTTGGRLYIIHSFNV